MTNFDTVTPVKTLTATAAKRKKAVNYVDNKKLYEHMVVYKTKVAESLAEGKEKPRVPEYVGECIFKIAKHLATKPNFANYPFREEMEGDAIDNCLYYIDNFNHEKYNNPFAYFTQISYFAFLRRIQREKKQLYIKQKTYDNARINGMVSNSQGGDTDSFTASNEYDSDYMNELVADFEKKKEDKKTKKVSKTDD